MYVANGSFTRVKGPSKYINEQPLCWQNVVENFKVINNIQRREDQDLKKKKDNTSGQFLQKAQNKEDSITVYSI